MMPTLKIDPAGIEAAAFVADQVAAKLDDAARAIKGHGENFSDGAADFRLGAADVRDGAADVRRAGREVLVGMLVLSAALLVLALVSGDHR